MRPSTNPYGYVPKNIKKCTMFFGLWLLALVAFSQLIACGGSATNTKMTVSGMTPSQLLTTGGQVAFTGTNFTKDTAVSFGGVAATQVYFQSPNLIAATVGATAASTVDVTVSSPENGTVTLPKALTFTAPPPPPVSQANCDGDICTYQGADPTNTLVGGAHLDYTCTGCPNGVKVGGLGNGAAVTFNNVTASADGTYNLTVFGVVSGSESYEVVVNGGSPITVPLTGSSWYNMAAPVTFTVPLTKGTNSITFGNPSNYSPDVVYFVISPTTYWAYDPNNTLVGGAHIDTTCTGCPQGIKVGGLGYGAAVTINNVYAPTAGNYVITIVGCVSGSESYEVVVNGGTPIAVPLTGGSWTSPAAPATITVPLLAGDSNTVELGNASNWSPDVVYISVALQ